LTKCEQSSRASPATSRTSGLHACTRSKRNTGDIMKWVIASVEQVYSHAVALGGVGEGVGVVKALDVACGTGIFARALAKLPGVVV
jgi:2-polyprenyl-3-methyl-5-hydroxy-6-metoxy-1,4-benzoquinol methylase